MPQGYYTIEQWTRPKKGADSSWVAVLQLPFGATLTAAEEALEQLGKPGLYRIVQMQRVIWAEPDAGTLRMRKSHASSPESLDKLRQMFERYGGIYPRGEVREARRQAKRKRSNESE